MKKHPDEILVLAGDVGGTKTNLGVFACRGGRPQRRRVAQYASGDFADLESMVARFVARHPADFSGACFGIPGPVINGHSRTTNLPWTVSGPALAARFGWRRVRLVNDLTAAALAVPLLRNTELHAINKARLSKGHNLALIAPGTGLGQALILCHDGQYHPVPSEGGHADFAPNDEEECDLWRYLRRKWGRVSTERVLCGPGIVNIYAWLRHSGRYREPAWLARRMAAGDPAEIISTAALTKRTPICVATLRRFVSILGAAAGDLALTGMATGGVFIGGGIPPRILPALDKDTFMRAFLNKGRMRPLLEHTPVRVILNQHAGLLGAARGAHQV